MSAVREQLVELARNLLADGLVVRTWGNFSVRATPADAASPRFFITPSGRGYTDLRPDELADVDLDGHWTGPLKPSSEHPMHTLVYRRYPEVGCVIHTHQPFASALSLSAGDVNLTDEQAARLGQSVLPVASYGLPGTKKLHRGVAAALDSRTGRIVLLSAHGAVIFAADPEQTRTLANEVEAVAREIFVSRLGADAPARTPSVARSELVAGTIRFYDAVGERVRPEPATRQRHERLYRQRPRTRAVEVSTDPSVLACGDELRPYLDDFAQIAGIRADASGRHAVTLGPDEALCAGGGADEAVTVRLVLEKNAKAARIARQAGRKPIADWEGVLMNRVYALAYSKKA